MDSAILTEIDPVRLDTAVQLITELYNIGLIALDSRKTTDDFCERHRLHSIQNYFEAKELNLMRTTVEAGIVYHISDAFQIHFLIFTMGGMPFVLGPFCPEVLTGGAAAEILHESKIHSLSVKQLLTYCGSYPRMSELEAFNIVNSFVHSVYPSEPHKIVRRMLFRSETQYENDPTDHQRDHHKVMLERRYASESKFIESIISGNARAAIGHLHSMKQDVKYLKKIGPTMESERVGAAIVRTTVRIAAIQAGLPALLIDRLSSENTAAVLSAGTEHDIYLSTENMVRNFCKAIREARESKYTALVQSALYYLNQGYAKEVNLEKLSGELNVSENYLISSFKKEVGMTPYTYLTKTRMKNAAQLLRSGSLSVSDVGCAVGIADPNYFAKLFKKEYGETPSAYRKRHTT